MDFRKPYKNKTCQDNRPVSLDYILQEMIRLLPLVYMTSVYGIILTSISPVTIKHDRMVGQFTLPLSCK